MANAPAKEKKERAKVDPNETAAQKFTRLARARTLVALKAMTQLENLGGNAYESTQAQRDAIINALAAQVQKVRISLNKEKVQKAEFDLPDADATVTGE